ncbi:glycine--tRNA ligase, partial [bacterium]|nr:glycine--tRNA ligase [bacterium]
MANKDQTDTARMEKIVSLCKRKGFIFQSAEIYGGLNGCWDYGPLGTEVKRNLKDLWWRKNVQERDDILGMDGSVLNHQAVLTASGHVGGFSDPMVDCKVCKKRYRADTLEEAPLCEKKQTLPKGEDKTCELTEPKEFNLMFKTQMGASADENDPNAVAYLRPETAQSIFVQYKNVMDSNRVKLPFGIAQIGKAFRNEINPRNFTFRSREFEQMEIEYFCRPEDGLRLTDEWLEKRLAFYDEIGLDKEKLHVLDIPDGERAHYSQ